MPDTLVEEAKQGKAEAIGELYDQYIKKIYQYLYWRTYSEAEAEDLAQEVFVKAWQNIKQFKKGSFQAWLYQIARNLWIDHWRKQKNEASLEPMDYKMSMEVDLAGDLDKKMIIAKIKKSIKELTKNYQEVLILRYLQDLSINETAHILKKSPGWVKINTHRAIQNLKNRYEQK